MYLVHTVSGYIVFALAITLVLFQHYESDADGLCTRLIRPLNKSDGHFEVAVDKKLFQDQGWTIKEKDLIKGPTLGKGEFGCK